MTPYKSGRQRGCSPRIGPRRPMLLAIFAGFLVRRIAEGSEGSARGRAPCRGHGGVPHRTFEGERAGQNWSVLWFPSVPSKTGRYSVANSRTNTTTLATVMTDSTARRKTASFIRPTRFVASQKPSTSGAKTISTSTARSCVNNPDTM